MPQERENPYPDFNPAESEALRTATRREQWAARCVATRKFGGIPKATFMRGENDHSAVMQGVLELTTAAYKLLDALDRFDDATGHPDATHADIDEAKADVKRLLEDPG